MIGRRPKGYRKSWRPCTCHPAEAPTPCARRYALSECLAAVDDGGLRGPSTHEAGDDNGLNPNLPQGQSTNGLNP